MNHVINVICCCQHSPDRNTVDSVISLPLTNVRLFSQGIILTTPAEKKRKEWLSCQYWSWSSLPLPWERSVSHSSAIQRSVLCHRRCFLQWAQNILHCLFLLDSWSPSPSLLRKISFDNPFLFITSCLLTGTKSSSFVLLTFCNKQSLK